VVVAGKPVLKGVGVSASLNSSVPGPKGERDEVEWAQTSEEEGEPRTGEDRLVLLPLKGKI